jgi:tRNA nucleotidyltransferase (CCA-adding enzyme)
LKRRLPHSIFRLLQQASRLTQRDQIPGYLVGGFVRDLLLDHPDHAAADIDLVVEGDGIAFAQSLAKTIGADVVIHVRFGTAVLCCRGGVRIDVATARSEQYASPAALPTVKPGSIKEDLYRRDFTINSLALRLDKERFAELVDYYGGQRDLRHHLIRVLHPRSFVDDPTRIFRAIRFEQRYRFRLEKNTRGLLQQAVKSHVIRRLSSTRLRQELILLLSEREPCKSIARLADLHLLQFIHPGLGRSRHMPRTLKAFLKNVKQGVESGREMKAESIRTWLVYLAALCETLSASALRTMLKRLHFARPEADLLQLAHAKSDRLLQALARAIRPSQVYQVLSGFPDELLLFLLAKARRQEAKRQIRAFMTDYRHINPRLSGTGLKAMGLKPGPMFKRLLERLRTARLDGEVKTVAEERELVRKLAKMKE